MVRRATHSSRRSGRDRRRHSDGGERPQVRRGLHLQPGAGLADLRHDAGCSGPVQHGDYSVLHAERAALRCATGAQKRLSHSHRRIRHREDARVEALLRHCSALTVQSRVREEDRTRHAQGRYIGAQQQIRGHGPPRCNHRQSRAARAKAQLFHLHRKLHQKRHLCAQHGEPCAVRAPCVRLLAGGDRATRACGGARVDRSACQHHPRAGQGRGPYR
mmetsp:Transcript_22843/g.51258  ORF Transcript_22843/g.51258 Transcript_22843/m.51258 type:complete len:217 (-) Transcript_22843:636-1286(-)